MGKIKDNCKVGIPILLLGNKTDLIEKREVNQDEAIALATEEEYIYKETSCVKNENVANAFETIVEMWNKEEQTSKSGRSKSKGDKENRKRLGSFSLTERSYSFTTREEDEDIEKDNFKIIDKKKHKKKRKKFC